MSLITVSMDSPFASFMDPKSTGFALEDDF
jgi:hypothetical protein